MSRKPKSEQKTEPAQTDGLTTLFGEIPENIMRSSALRHSWSLNFLVNHLHLPLYRNILKTTGISQPQIVTLFFLLENDGLQASEISQMSAHPKNSISRAVIELVKSGLITQTDHKIDKRAKSLAITDKGREVMAEILPRFLQRQAGLRNALTEEELATFDQLLQKLISAIPNWVDEGLEAITIEPLVDGKR